MAAYRYAFLAIPLLGLAELGAHLWTSRRPPAFDDWFGVEAAVRRLKQEGDVVVIAPHWADPAARRALGDTLMPLRDVARPDESRYAHALEVSVLGQRSPELSLWKEETRHEQGKFVLRRLANPRPATVTYDFVDHARPPFADVRGTDPTVTCGWNPAAAMDATGFGGHPTFPSERFECPAGQYLFVGATVIADQNYLPRRCLWSHPFARGEIVTRFRDVPLGKVIRGHGGLSWYAEREKKGAPVTLVVRVDGAQVGTLVHSDGDGWAPFEFDLGARGGAPRASVEFAVSSADYRDRHFCFEADSR